MKKIFILFIVSVTIFGFAFNVNAAAIYSWKGPGWGVMQITQEAFDRGFVGRDEFVDIDYIFESGGTIDLQEGIIHRFISWNLDGEEMVSPPSVNGGILWRQDVTGTDGSVRRALTGIGINGTSTVFDTVAGVTIIGGAPIERSVQGHWRLQSADNPLMPISTTGGIFNFSTLEVSRDQLVFYDPILAIGYDYEVQTGANFGSVILPTGIGDDMYDLHLFDPTLGEYSSTPAATLTGGVEFDITQLVAGGLDRFRILGIEESAALDPTDTTAFVTGLSHVNDGLVAISQSAVRFDTDRVEPVPEPTTVALLGIGLVGLAGAEVRRRRKKKAVDNS